MVNGSAEPKTRCQRQSHAKVKSGCLTCKIRRVKCDETKPSCLRCTSTWRKCDGYKGKEPLKFINTTTTQTENTKSPRRDAASASSGKCSSNSMLSRLIGSPQNLLLDFSGTKIEHRSLDFFRNGSAPALAGYFDSEFWSKILPRVAHSEAPVQHAMIALGSLYEYCSGTEEYPSFMQQRHALVHYNKAIRALKSCSVEDPKTREVTLLTCVLFVCLELLGGNPERALDHLENGLNILRHSQRYKVNISLLDSRIRAGPRTAHTNQQSIEGVLSETFSRLSLQASLCARRLPQIYPNEDWAIVEDSKSARVPFNRLQEARISLNEIFVQCFQPMGLLNVANHPSVGINTAKQAQRESLSEQLHYWNSRLALYVTDSLPNLPQEEIQGSRVLRILSIIAIIWNSTTEDPLESAYDSHLENYATVISLASSFIQESTTSSPATTTTLSSVSTLAPMAPTPSRLNSKQGSSSTFTFEMGIIPALYFTAIKCRSPSLRRKAIDMLKKAMPPREGLWDARVLAGIAQRIMEIEEAEGCSEDVWPAEARRIHGIYLTPNYCTVDRRQEVILSWRPGGPTGEWLQFGEKIVY